MAELDIPKPSNKVAGGVGVSLLLLGGAIVAGASDMSEALELVASVISGSHMVSTEMALSAFLIIAGLGGALQSYFAGYNIEQIDEEMVHIGIIYPALIGAIASGLFVGYQLVPNDIEYFDFR